MTRATLLLVLGFATLAFGVGGCGDGDGGLGQPPVAVVWGTVLSIEDSVAVPIASAQVALVDPRDLSVVAGPVSTDSTGTYAFIDPPVGTYSALIFHSGHFVFDRTASLVTVVPSDSVRQDFRLIAAGRYVGSGDYRISGIIVAQATGQPIAGAFVGPLYSGMAGRLLRGETFPYQAVTDEGGRYLLERVTIVPDFAGVPTWLAPVGVSKAGYASYHGELLPFPEGPDSTQTLNVELYRDGPTAALYGHVSYLGVPVPGLRVALNYADSLNFDLGWFDKQQVVVQGKVAITDGNGAYAISGLTPGFYSIEAAYLPNDGYAAYPRAYAQGTVRAGDSLELPVINLLKGIHPIAPTPGSEVTSVPIEFRWETVAGADRYTLWLSGSQVFNRAITVHDSAGWVSSVPSIPPDLTGHFRWYVDALRANTLLATFEEIATFTVRVDTSGSGLAERK